MKEMHSSVEAELPHTTLLNGLSISQLFGSHIKGFTAAPITVSMPTFKEKVMAEGIRTVFEDPFSEEVWSSTYKDHNDVTVNDTMYRVAAAVASMESTEELRQEWARKFYDLLSGFKATSGGRIYANAGTEWGGTTLMNCYVGPRGSYDIDSLHGILDALRSQATTLKSEGGWGENFSYIRPRGSFIHGIGVETPGAVKYMEVFDKSSEIITAGSGKKSLNKKAKGKIRKGAMMGVMDIWHPDIIEFITAKQQPGRLTKFNISVNCTDEFMDKITKVIKWKAIQDDAVPGVGAYTQAVHEQYQHDLEEFDKWDLIFPETTHGQYKAEWDGDIAKWKAKGYPVVVFNTVSALWLWNLIMESTYNRAEPGVLFLDRANYFGPLNYAETIFATNPCGEQTLSPGNVCNLGSLNLVHFLNKARTGFDLERVKQYTEYLVRFLDNVSDLSKAPLPEYEYSMKNKRRIGVGILGWGSALYMLKTRLGSDNANALREELMRTIAQTAYTYSVELAEEKGMFPLCEPEKHVNGAFVQGLGLPAAVLARMAKTGIRNSSLLSIQPTGNTSIFANVVSGGLEPVFMHEYIRTVIVNAMPEHIALVTPRWFEGEWRETEMFKFVKEGDEEILRGVDKNGTVYKIDKNRGLTKEVLCEDFGVRYMKRIGEWDSAADWAATTVSMSVADHVNDLTGFARWVDSAMSKCVAEGTLISTNRGLKPIESLGIHDTHQEGFVIPSNDYTVLDENGQEKNITSHYFGGIKPCITVRFNNGFELTGAHTHKLKCVTGWTPLDGIAIGDKVFYRTNPFIVDRPQVIPPQPTFAPNAKHTKFPQIVDEDFALLLGMWVADGSLTDHSVSICEKNDNVSALCERLMLQLFDTHCAQVDNRWDVQTHYVHSSSIARWFRHEFGHGAENKHIPQWLLDSPVTIWRAFIEGLTLDGYLKTGDYGSSLVVFDGYAKDVSEKVTHMLSTLGVQYSLCTRSVGEGKTTYGVTAWLEDTDTIVPIEDHKQKYSVQGKTQKQTYVSDDVFDQLIAQQANNTYGSIIRARLRKCKQRGNFVRMSFLEKTGLEFDRHLTCVTVTDIQNAGSQRVYDIEVEDTHSYLINGVVSHNTVNVPNEYPVEMFNNIYLDAYKSSYVKGVTTYRSGTMTTVLAAKDEKNADPGDEEIILSDVKLPDSSPATVKILKAEDRKWYLTVIWNDQQTRPFALFVHTNSHEKSITTTDAVDHLVQLARTKGIPERHIDATLEKSSSDSNATKIARLISMNLRHGVLIKNIVLALEQVPDIFVGSFLFQIKKFLSTFIKDGEKVQGQVCESCGSNNIVYSEGCQKCASCGSSKCG